MKCSECETGLNYASPTGLCNECLEEAKIEMRLGPRVLPCDRAKKCLDGVYRQAGNITLANFS